MRSLLWKKKHKREKYLKENLRERFLNYVPAGKRVLEIGPFTNPTFRQYGVYFDLFNKDGLSIRAIAEGLDPAAIPEIDYVDPTGNLNHIKEKFSYVYSAHVIEHQPDLIHHLKSVSQLLEPGGEYLVIAPDKRYCFDHFIPESSVKEILRAHHENRRKPGILEVFEHRALTCHNDSRQHWNGNHGLPFNDLKTKYDNAIHEFNSSAYVDVHCWQFTPDSIKYVIEALHSLDVCDFEVSQIYQTATDDIEFGCVLRKL
jgi:SAM-dependent methyltransferase